ncbi:hypothetical protein ACEQ8H_003271 [Pleosporales sp. CAS-2024a]
MDLEHQFIRGKHQKGVEDEDVTDDSVVIKSSLPPPAELLHRLVQRLSKLTRADITLHESRDQKAINLYLTRSKGSDQTRLEEDAELKLLIKGIESSLSVAKTHVKDDLMDDILVYAYSNIKHVVGSLQVSMATNQDIMDELVTSMFGVLDVSDCGSKLDHELGDVLIRLRQNVQSYDKSMGQSYDLMKLAASIATDISHLHQRMKSLLLKTKFSNELYRLILALGSPRRAYYTLVAAAMTNQAFSNVTFHLSVTVPSPPLTRPPSPPTLQYTVPAVPPARTASSAPGPAPEPDSLSIVQPFLAPEDSNLDLFRLQPASKRATAQLASAVLRDKLLPLTSAAYHAFGFATLRSEEEERILGGLYRALLLEESATPRSIFASLTHALATHSLPTLIRAHQYNHILAVLSPALPAFLCTPAHARPTVWLLKPFVAHVCALDDTNTDKIVAPPYLHRDYGFRYCRQPTEIRLLASIYAAMLDAIDPAVLHQACIRGRLYELASRSGYAKPRHRRLLVNDYPVPAVGFENGRALQGYYV